MLTNNSDQHEATSYFKLASKNTIEYCISGYNIITGLTGIESNNSSNVQHKITIIDTQNASSDYLV